MRTSCILTVAQRHRCYLVVFDDKTFESTNGFVGHVLYKWNYLETKMAIEFNLKIPIGHSY